MYTALRKPPNPILLLPTIVLTDSDIHSPLWNPDTYSQSNANAKKVVDAMTNWDLFFRLPKGTAMYEAKAGMTLGVTIDLVWVNQQADNILIACLVDIRNHLNHHSDYHTLFTVVRIECDNLTRSGMLPPLEKAWHKAHQSKFLAELKA